jgi:hypothetical protein
MTTPTLSMSRRQDPCGCATAPRRDEANLPAYFVRQTLSLLRHRASRLRNGVETILLAIISL